MLSVKEAAKRMGVSASKLYQLASERKVAHFRIGGKIVFLESDLEAYLLACRIEPKGRTSSPPPGPFKNLNAEKMLEEWRKRGVSVPPR